MNGNKCEITNKDLEVIVKFLQQGVLTQLQKYQSLDNSDFDEISLIYHKLIIEDPSPKESIQSYFEHFFEIQNKSSDDLTKNQLESRWKRVLDWIAAESVKDSSIMIKWTEDNFDPSIARLLDIKIIDIDTKL